MCLPLIKAIQDGVQKRFGEMMDPELISAAILLPKFKTTWTERPDIIEAGWISTYNILWFLMVYRRSIHFVLYSIQFSQCYTVSLSFQVVIRFLFVVISAL